MTLEVIDHHAAPTQEAEHLVVHELGTRLNHPQIRLQLGLGGKKSVGERETLLDQPVDATLALSF
jgi:hypothetical protein